MRTTTTWLCPGCGASTVQDTSPGICPACRQRAMVLWNISTERESVSPMSIGYPDEPLSRWLEDRAERRCLFCKADFAEFDPQAFVALVFKEGNTFCIGASCEDCALDALESGTIRPAHYEDMAIVLPENKLSGAVEEAETEGRPLRVLKGGRWVEQELSA